VTGASEAALSDAYDRAATPGTRAVVLDFGGLQYMNSSGIGLLVTLLVRANRNHQRMLAYGLSEHYRQIFELTRLDEAIAIHETEDAALAAAA
jgi:anti-sigma B factor antagonist